MAIDAQRTRAKNPKILAWPWREKQLPTPFLLSVLPRVDTSPQMMIPNPNALGEGRVTVDISFLSVTLGLGAFVLFCGLLALLLAVSCLVLGAGVVGERGSCVRIPHPATWMYITPRT